MDCPRREECRLPEGFPSPFALRLWQERYCEGDFRECARLRAAEQGRPVPDGMLPSGHVLAAAT